VQENLIYRKKNQIPFWKQCLSFLYPILIEKCNTPTYLELLLDKNQLILNSENANQSNQNLKQAFNLVFHKLGIYNKKLDKLLLLGLGLGSIIELLQSKGSLKRVVAYENSEQVLNWVSKYYEINHVEIRNQSAYEVIALNEKFDLIVIDLFIDNSMPEFLQDINYWYHLKSRLKPNGIIIWNTLINQPTTTSIEIGKLFDRNVEVMGMNRMWVYEN